MESKSFEHLTTVAYHKSFFSSNLDPTFSVETITRPYQTTVATTMKGMGQQNQYYLWKKLSFLYNKHTEKD